MGVKINIYLNDARQGSLEIGRSRPEELGGKLFNNMDLFGDIKSKQELEELIYALRIALSSLEGKRFSNIAVEDFFHPSKRKRRED